MGAEKGKTQVRPMKEENTAKNKENFLKAFEKSMGVIAPACKKVNVSRRTVYVWLENDPEFKKDFEDVKEFALDFTESKLLENINKGKETSIIFHLKTIGKKRGYIERTEQENVQRDEFSDMTDEEIQAEIDREENN